MKPKKVTNDNVILLHGYKDILKNLKDDKNEDVAKGQAVKNQKV